MDEQKPPNAVPLEELIERVVQAAASDDQKQMLQARLLASTEDRKTYLHYLNLHSALKRQFAFDGTEETPNPSLHLGLPRDTDAAPLARKPRIANWSMIAAVVAVVALLVAAFSLTWSERELPIAKIAGLSGALQWTGDGGRVLDELAIGTELPGGTVEGMTPSSWFELEFIDGSTVTISGNSMLTFSDRGQKRLHLKEGNISANVTPQPAGKPMLVYTRSAVLEVVGTQFDVQAGLAATMLNVSQGEVRVTRLSDSKTVNVLARHRLIAAAGRNMAPEPVPDSVRQWKSQLHLGPTGAFGQWLPATDEEDARLGTVPYTTSWGKTIYIAAFGISRGDRPPVILQSDSRFRVRGRIASAHEIYFGVTVRNPDGEFAGKFQTIRPADEFQDGENFELLLDLEDFQLDPTLAGMKARLPSDPFGSVVESIWCHTLYEHAGLEITEVDLLSSTSSAGPPPAATGSYRHHVMDIWTAASKGDLKALRYHLDAGADINAAIVVPGIPASGATPLHLAVLADQRTIADFLIERGADLASRARDEHGGTPLHWAAALGRNDMAKRLLEAGADVNAPDNHGYTPLDATNYAPEYKTEAKATIADFLRTNGAVTRDQEGTVPARR